MKSTRTRFLIGVGILVLANIGFSSKAVIIKLMYRYDVDTYSVIALRMIFSLPFFLSIQNWLRRLFFLFPTDDVIGSNPHFHSYSHKVKPSTK